MANGKRSRRPVVVVTGAGAGIGCATAAALLASGWAVVGIDRSPGRLKPLTRRHRARAAMILGDTGDRKTHEQAALAADKLGGLMGWVNNAGIERPTLAHHFSQKDFDDIFRVNALGYAMGCSVACEVFMQSGVAGRIVNVSSIRAIASFPSGFVYEASKGSVEAMTRQVAIEYGHLGIRCNAVRPGCIMTPMSRSELRASRNAPALLKQWGDLHPLERRVGQPREVAAAIVFLLSDQASFISGVCLNVDGGATARCYPYPADRRLRPRQGRTPGSR